MLVLIARAIGFFLLGLGMLGILTPIPLGAFFLLLALVFLIPTTPAVARMVAWGRGRSVRFDDFMERTTARMPVPYRRILRRTRPGGGSGFRI